MAFVGAKDSPSRLGVKMLASDGHKYDQVIALTQGNINESLERYFLIQNPDGLKFQASIKGALRMSLEGEIDPPEIELIDEDGADKALYCLKFTRDSKFTHWAPEDPEDEESRYVAYKYDANGWKIAFEVSFALKEIASAPESIREQLQTPGDYSVSQLAVVFGTADLLRFDWSRSVISLQNNDTIADVRTVFKFFIDKWLTATKMRDDPAKHNILGYAVTAKNPQAVQPAAPSFPPTSVRLQTINHRPNGDEKQARTDSAFNAFLFTEMCGNRPMIPSDLPWSGDLFYESIGGTLLMGRHIFWDDYVAHKLAPTNKLGKTIANTLARPFAPNQSGEWVLSDDSADEDRNDFDVCDDKTLRYNWERRREFQYKKRDVTMKPIFETTIKNCVRQLQKNAFEFCQSLDFATHTSGDIDPFFFNVGTYHLSLKVNCVITTVFTMSSVEATGRLDVDVKTLPYDIRIETDSGFSGGAIEVLKTFGMDSVVDFLEGKMNQGDLKKKVKDVADGIVQKILEVGNDLSKVFNNQSKFVFPGGGTFDMKDPLFTDDGDLAIGLVYRK